MKRKKIEERFFITLMVCSTYLIISTLLLLMVVILKRGFSSLSLEMITQVPKGGFYFGKEGGILNAILGSFYLAFGATILAFIISLPAALFMNIYFTGHRKVLEYFRFFLDLLWGVPSIVYGAFGFAVMLFIGLRASLLAGMVTITLLIIPIMIRAMDEVLKTVPFGLLEASYSLGSTKTEISFKVFFKQALPGIVTAILLAFGRGIGDAASILFTAGYTDYIPTSVMQPTATLPLAIFFQLSSPIPEVQERAYASAVILTVIILIISILTRVLTKKFKGHIIS